jgi:hypothetical protein
MDAELRKQPTTDERANNSNDEIADDPKSGALHDLAGQPSGNEADPNMIRRLSFSWTNPGSENASLLQHGLAAGNIRLPGRRGTTLLC